MQMASFVLMPALLGLAAVSENFVEILYTSMGSYNTVHASNMRDELF